MRTTIPVYFRYFRVALISAICLLIVVFFIYSLAGRGRMVSQDSIWHSPLDSPYPTSQGTNVCSANTWAWPFRYSFGNQGNYQQMTVWSRAKLPWVRPEKDSIYYPILYPPHSQEGSCEDALGPWISQLRYPCIQHSLKGFAFLFPSVYSYMSKSLWKRTKEIITSIFFSFAMVFPGFFHDVLCQ